MNTPSSPSNADRHASPRWRCRAVRVLQSRQNDAADELGLVARHRAKCPACAAYFARVANLEARLRQDARETAPVEMPEGLEGRIWAAVQPEVASRRRPVRSRGMPGWRPVTVGALAVLAVVVGWVAQSPSSSLERQPVARGEAVDFNEADIRELWATLETQSSEWLTTIARVDARETRATVLQEELEALGSDARGALRFLELNFVPSSLRSREGTI